MAKKILIVCTTDSMIWNFLVPHIRELEDLGYTVECACSETGYFFDELIRVHGIKMNKIGFERSPYNLKNVKAYRKLSALIKQNKYDAIFCHEPIGGVMGRLAGKRHHCHVMYMVHGFHFYKGAPLINWLLYYPVEKILAHFTDVLITINQEDYERAKSFKAGKICYVPGVGIDTSRFQIRENIDLSKRRSLGLNESDFVLLSVGELIPRKNHASVLQAIAKLKDSDSYENIKYAICGQGVLEKELKELAKQLQIEDKVLFLGYRQDINEICRCSDVFVFPSYQEGLSVALMEAMACGLPVVCSDIRGNTDLIENGVCGITVAPQAEEIAAAVITLMSAPEKREEYALAAAEKITRFDIESVKEDCRKIYLQQ